MLSICFSCVNVFTQHAISLVHLLFSPGFVCSFVWVLVCKIIHKCISVFTMVMGWAGLAEVCTIRIPGIQKDTQEYKNNFSALSESVIIKRPLHMDWGHVQYNMYSSMYEFRLTLNIIPRLNANPALPFPWRVFREISPYSLLYSADSHHIWFYGQHERDICCFARFCTIA